MANSIIGLSSVKNLREWLTKKLEDKETYLHRVTEDGVEEICYNVDLVWDGTNYHIAYTNEDSSICKVFPFTYTDQIVWSIHHIDDEDAIVGE